MPFESGECTEQLCRELGIQSLLQKSYTNPIGLSVYYDIAEQIALIAYRDDHTTYPDRSFKLCIKGHCMNVWQKISVQDQRYSTTALEVYVNEHAETFTDDFLSTVIRQTISGLLKSEDCGSQIFIKGRKPPRKEPRTPEAVVTGINKFVELMPQGGFDTAVDLFVPLCVRPDEINAFITYGEQTSWSGLSEAARKLVELGVKKRST